jgi:hypothetical protein
MPLFLMPANIRMLDVPKSNMGIFAGKSKTPKLWSSAYTHTSVMASLEVP